MPISIRPFLTTFLAVLAGCATYQPLPLSSPQPPQSLADVRIDVRGLPFPALAAHRFDPSDGLDIVEAAMLAVANNPDLRLARGDAAIARAQAFAAGLLPDPQLALNHDLSNTGGAGSTPAFSYGLSYDVGALLQHAALRGAAQGDEHKADLNLLWQEWQVVSQARLLFVKLSGSRQLAMLLEQNRVLFADRAARIRQALGRGLMTSDAALPNLAALQDVERQQYELAKLENQLTHDFNALLGLDPDAYVLLQEDREPGALDEAAVAEAQGDLVKRRPDLLALEAGYGAEDQRYRAALLAQFPALSIGLTRARDSSDVYSNAIGVTLSLPIFNRNRGSIAIELATRQKLHDEYQQRVHASRNDVARLLAEQRLNQAQLLQLDRAIEELGTALARSELAFKSGNIDALLYANARGALLAKQVERANLRQASLEQRVALQTVLGVAPAELPPSKKASE